MKLYLFFIILLSSLITLVTPRPVFTGIPGYKVTPTEENGRHYQYNSKTEQFPLKHPFIKSLEYEATAAENAHSADFEDTIETVKCFPNSISITLNNADSPVSQWPIPFIFAMGREWGCEIGKSSVRKVVSIIWEGKTAATFITEDATIAEAFESAKFHLSSSQPNSKKVSISPSIYHTSPVQPVIPPKHKKNTLNVRTSAVEFNNFRTGQCYQTGDTITVNWEYTSSTPASQDTIEVGIMNSSGYVVSTFVSYTATSASFPVTDSFLSSTEYYVELQWTVYDCDFYCTSDYDSDYFSINYRPPLSILSPTMSTVLFAGNSSLTVSWVQNLVTPQTLYIYLMYSNEYLPDSTISSTTFDSTATTPTTNSITMDTLSSYESSSNYYVEIEYDCIIFCTAVYTDLFSIVSTSPTSGIQILSPDSSSSFKVGDTLNIQWTYGGMPGSTPLNLYIMEYSWGLDPTIYTVPATVPVSDLAYSFIIPSFIGDDTDYYIEIEYDCGTFLCDYAYSQTFSIISNPLFTFILPTPTYGEMRSPGTSITVSWTSVSSIGTSEEIYIELYEKYPSFLPDVLFDTHASDQLENGVGQWAYTPLTGTIFPVYFVIKYDCLILDYFCTNTRSPLFFIPSTYDSTWSYDAPLLTFSCENCTDDSSSNFCYFCDKGVSMEASLVCTDCSLESSVYATDMTLDIANYEITALTFYASGFEDLTINLDANAAVEYQNTWNFHLATFPIVGFSAYLLFIQINIGFTLDLATNFTLDLGGSVDLQVLTESRATWNVSILYGTGYQTTFQISSDLEPVHPPQYIVQAAAHANADLMLLPEVSFSIPELVNVDFLLIPELAAHADIKYPEYGPTSNPLVPGTLFEYGDCETLHWVQYSVNFTLSGIFDATVLFAEHHFHNNYNFLTYPLMSGCLLTSTNSSVAHSVELYLSSTLQSLGLTADQFIQGMLAQLGIVQPDLSSRLVINGLTNYGNGYLVTLYIVPSNTGQDDFSTLHNYISNQIGSTSSNFYNTNQFGQNLKGNLGLFSPSGSSSYTTPSTSSEIDHHSSSNHQSQSHQQSQSQTVSSASLYSFSVFMILSLIFINLATFI